MGRNTGLRLNWPTMQGTQTTRAIQECRVRSESMEKSITFDQTAFGADVLRKAVAILDERTSNNGIVYSFLKTSLGEATWTYDEVEEFWAEYPKATGPVVFWAKGKGTSELRLVLYVHGTGNRRWTSVSVTGSTRADIESVFNIFEASREASRFPDEPVQAKGKIFIGHGGQRPLARPSQSPCESTGVRSRGLRSRRKSRTRSKGFT